MVLPANSGAAAAIVLVSLPCITFGLTSDVIFIDESRIPASLVGDCL
jgi:hypothetical protein